MPPGKLGGLEASAEGARAQAYQTLDVRARRAADTYERRGLELPENVAAARDFVDDSYLATTPDKLVYPDQAREQYLATHRPALEAERQAALERLKAFDAVPFDEEQAVRDVLRKKGSRVSKNEAYQLARKLGLDVGDFETFDVLPPEGGWKLSGQAPDAPAPLPDASERRLARIQQRREELTRPEERAVRQRKPEAEILQKAGLPVPPRPSERRLASLDRRLASLENPAPVPTPTRKPEAEILQEAGLDKTEPLTPRIDFKAAADTRRPVEERVDAMVERAGPVAREKVLMGALKGAAPGGLAAQLPLPGVKAPGTVAALAGGVLGARGAIRQLTAIDVKTGDFRNPAAAAAVFGALERVLMKYPNLGKRYARAIMDPSARPGHRALQAAFYINEDPELAAALDEDARTGDQ